MHVHVLSAIIRHFPHRCTKALDKLIKYSLVWEAWVSIGCHQILLKSKEDQRITMQYTCNSKCTGRQTKSHKRSQYLDFFLPSKIRRAKKMTFFARGRGGVAIFGEKAGCLFHLFRKNSPWKQSYSSLFLFCWRSRTSSHHFSKRGFSMPQIM